MRSVIVPVVLLAVLGAGCPPTPGPAGPLTKGWDDAQHEDYFPIGAGSTHELDSETFGGPLSCNGCHGGGDTFKEFFCVACHLENPDRPLLRTHDGMPDFALEEARCLGCHPTGEKRPPPPPTDGGPPQDTHPAFPIDDAFWGVEVALHSTANPVYAARQTQAQLFSCGGCHEQVYVNNALVRCDECHAYDAAPTVAEAHADPEVQPSYTEVVECKTCHAVTPVPDVMHPIANHAALLDGQWPHITVDQCIDCHKGGGLPVPRAYGTDFSVVSCVDCHDASCTADDLAGCGL